MIQILIQVDMNTGQVAVQGPIDEPRIMHYALGEVLRIVNRRSEVRDAEAGKRPQIVLARELPPNGR